MSELPKNLQSVAESASSRLGEVARRTSNDRLARPGLWIAGLSLLGLGALGLYYLGPDLRRYIKIERM